MIARYDQVADFYADGFSSLDPALSALLDIVGPVDGKRVLDLACGHGRAARALAGRGADVTGVELSQALLHKATGEGIAYVVGNAAALPLTDATFDVVTCNFALSDIDDLDATLAGVTRVLRPGGVFAFSILHPCFPGGAQVSGAWPAGGRYYDEGFWVPAAGLSALRRQVGANHRTLTTYVNSLSRHGLHLTALTEPEPPAEWAASPSRRDAAAFPLYLVARCLRAV